MSCFLLGKSVIAQETWNFYLMQIALSPQKIPERESGTPQPITPETEAYLRKTNNIFEQNKALPDHETLTPSSTALFNESWPSTLKSSR